MSDRSQCVITLGVTSPAPPGYPMVTKDFIPGIRRIRKTLARTSFSGSFFSWENGFPVDAPSHVEAPFAFKPFCFREAKTKGFRFVLWLDASIRIKRPIQCLFDLIEENGYLLFHEKHSAGSYCKDAALAPLGISREESFTLPSCRGAVIGLDLHNQTAAEFLRRWTELALDGITFPGAKWSGERGWPVTVSTDPRVRGHRGDQTAASVIAYKLGMTRWCDKATFDRFFENERVFLRPIEENILQRNWARIRLFLKRTLANGPR